MLRDHDSSYSDSLFVRILSSKFCRLNRRHNFFDETQPLNKLDNLEFLEILGEGGFGRVFKCHNVEDNSIVAVKQICIRDSDDAVPAAIIREISFLKELNHPNVVRLLGVINKGTRFVNLVFEYLDCNLSQYIKENQCCGSCSSFNDPMNIKSFLYQILSAVNYCHCHEIIHRDLKPTNLLIDRSEKIIKLADFGLARELGDPDMKYIEEVATSCYRAPEILFECGKYSTPIDIWSVGCIFGEMLLGKPILEGKYWMNELEMIFCMFGTPKVETWPEITKLCTNITTYPKYEPMDLSTIFYAVDPTGLNLLTTMLCLNPNKRITAEAALKHAYFNDLVLHPVCLLLLSYCIILYVSCCYFFN
ncbi:cyclin-dependent kinase [Trifolium repens]|nr:cyclin-dependent kinase [Trifolium repens]